MPERPIYQIILSPQARKALGKLPISIQQRIDTKILSLFDNPRPSGVKKLQGYEGLLRIRVGKYRIIYQIENERLLIIVLQIGHRRDIYRKTK